MTIARFKTILPGLYLLLVAFCLVASIPALFTDQLSFCSGSLVSVCLPYGIIGIILLHLPLALILGPVLNYIDSRNIYPSLAIIFFSFFLLNILITLGLGTILDRIFFRKPPSSTPPPTITNPLHNL